MGLNKGTAYLFLFLAVTSWSFSGVLVKTASMMVDSMTITFSRFVLGAVFLGILIAVKDRGFKLNFRMKWVWYGALGKAANYFFECLGIAAGYSYGNILVSPIQTVLLLFLSVWLFKEKVTAQRWVAALLCIVGVLLLTWNGNWSDQMGGGGLTTLFFVLSAIGVVFHVLSQKMLISEMDAGNMNLSVFLLCSLLLVLPLPITFEWSGEIHIGGLTALVAMGLSTGLSFYWFARSLQVIPFSVAAIISNCAVLLTVLWSYLFFNEPITSYVIVGVVVCLAGLLVLNLSKRSRSGAGA